MTAFHALCFMRSKMPVHVHRVRSVQLQRPLLYPSANTTNSRIAGLLLLAVLFSDPTQQMHAAGLQRVLALMALTVPGDAGVVD